MGFPDTFQIPVSDTQAYKQFGNSVVVPVIEEVARIMGLPDVQERMAKLDIKPVGSTSADLAKTISQEIQLWTQVAKDNNIKAE